MASLLKPQDLNEMSHDAESEKVDEERRAKKKKDEQQSKLRDEFMARAISPEVVERVNKAISAAAKQGHHQLQVITFPCTYTSDGGRRINIGDPEWPSTLEGFAKRAYDFYTQELKPLGYKLHAEIISFPGGMPGEAALFLKW